MTTTKSYDNLNRLLSISSSAVGTSSTSSVASFDYLYNDANQRVRVAQADGTFWLYEYDKLGQLISAKPYWSDNTPVAGQQYEYAYDDIGNRTSTKQGGDSGGAGLRPASYSANSLNQYTSRDVPGAADIIGIAHPSASVTVNGVSPYRKSEYFWKELSINNTSAPVWQGVTNIASLGGTNQTNTGSLFLSKTAETFGYDADGNLTNDGHWAYTWDGENRLLTLTAPSTIPTGARQALAFTYDSQSRRVTKTVSNWTGNAWSKILDQRFVYDGWNLIAELNATNNATVRSYLWGLDLSGKPQGAGGVEGLIELNDAATSIHFAAYDGNGNIVALIQAADGSTCGKYEHDPFGQSIRVSTTCGFSSPLRFSTKYCDDETTICYYGYRFYNPNPSRWLNRDPHEELGGANIFGFIGNASVSRIDPLGLDTFNDRWSIAHGHNIPADWVEGTPGPQWTIGGEPYEIGTVSSILTVDVSTCHQTGGGCSRNADISLTLAYQGDLSYNWAMWGMMGDYRVSDDVSQNAAPFIGSRLTWDATVSLGSLPCKGGQQFGTATVAHKSGGGGIMLFLYNIDITGCGKATAAMTDVIASKVAGDTGPAGGPIVRQVRRISSSYLSGPFQAPYPQYKKL